MEGDETKAPFLGNLDAYAPSPIWMGCRDEDLYFTDDDIEGDGARVLHQSIELSEGCKEKRKKYKKKK